MQYPTDGYMVSLEGLEVRIGTKAFSPQWLDHFILRNRTLLENPNYYVGAWVENGFVYLDISECTNSLEQATKLARQRNQLAIYDVSCGVVIQVAGTVASSTPPTH